MKILITFLLIMASTNSQTNIEIKDLQWKNRVLLVFPSDKNAKGLDLTDAIQEDLVERDLIYFYFGDELESNSPYTFTKNHQKELQKLYGSGTDKGNYVLIGKDGGSKLEESGNEINWQLLFSTIDSMPMRIREMKNKPQ
ncbi:DUF4174 domain-containing protein [Cyclobacterium sp. 1_MG-2023]|uniref:DUF4174 domain-containing protein n=1 Tax=Cyclobacterium sp. 1_MG-2023 TaxID=3062681 RepID=UPI0026E258CB|nr:DUF4174 domain-containing protein [Cyclobacterium sp. 1_MG-2023]MDO6437288.1 DUF4174 domain-containing protein [Cyclobacterium sp. 1_MG-2023]